MKKDYGKRWDYLGSFIGFIGALLMAIAMATTGTEGGHSSVECVTRLIKNDIEPNVALQNCERPFVIMEHPFFNLIGIILISIGFFVQFFPIILQFFASSYEDDPSS